MKKLESKVMNIEIELDGALTSIIGGSGSGKTYFLKRLMNKIKGDDIYLDNISVNDYDIKFLKKNIFVVLDEDIFKCEYVAEELFFYLNTLGYKIDEITKKIHEFVRIFKLKGFENRRLDSLTVEMRTYIRILSMLITNPSIIAFDNLFPYLKEEHIELIMKYIKKKNISLINVINNAEYLKYTNQVIVINEMKSIYSGTVEDLLKGNSILPYIGIKLPFTVDLSNNLILYGLVDNVYFDIDKLVNKLWK